MGASFNIAPVTTKDLEPLACFLADGFGKDESPEYWQSRFNHWWDANPAFKSKIPRGWILLEREEIRGFLGNVPTPLVVNGSHETAFNMTTWRVSPEAKASSMKLLFAFLEAAKEHFVFNTTANADVRQILSAMRFARVPFQSDKVARLLTSREGLKFALAKRNVPRFVAWIAGFMVERLFQITDGAPSRFGCRWTKVLDQDTVSQLAQCHPNVSASIDRSVQLYDWYAKAPASDFEYLLVRLRNKPVYLAVLCWSFSGEGLQGEILEGLPIVQTTKEISRAVISEVSRRARQRKAGSIIVYGHATALIEATRKRPFSSINPAKGKEFFKAPKNFLQRKTGSEQTLFFTRLLGDIGL